MHAIGSRAKSAFAVVRRGACATPLLLPIINPSGDRTGTTVWPHGSDRVGTGFRSPGPERGSPPAAV